MEQKLEPPKTDFSNIKVALIGDLCVDEFKYGSADRLSPECPVPVVLLKESIKTLGAAGNTACNLVDLGAKVDLYSIIGCDRFGGVVLELLGNKKINFAGAYEHGKPTIVKTRIVANGNHQIVRVDREDKFTIDVTENINFKEIDGVLISDYAKGTINKNIRKVIEKAKEKGLPIFVDPKEKNINLYSGATVIKLNNKEAFNITGIKNEEKAATMLLNDLGAKYVIITKGGDGVVAVSSTEKYELNAEPVGDLIDVSGAGDTVLATFALSYLVDNNVYESLKLANKAAGVAVSKKGTATCSIEELRNCLNL